MKPLDLIRLTLLISFLMLSMIRSSMAADPSCINSLRSINTIENGIPTNRVNDYEKCVSQLKATIDEEKKLLKICCKKLIEYYSLRNEQQKVDQYEALLKSLK